jgi:hypothetical protein
MFSVEGQYVKRDCLKAVFNQALEFGKIPVRCASPHGCGICFGICRSFFGWFSQSESAAVDFIVELVARTLAK